MRIKILTVYIKTKVHVTPVTELHNTFVHHCKALVVFKMSDLKFVFSVVFVGVDRVLVYGRKNKAAVVIVDTTLLSDKTYLDLCKALVDLFFMFLSVNVNVNHCKAEADGKR